MGAMRFAHAQAKKPHRAKARWGFFVRHPAPRGRRIATPASRPRAARSA